MQDWNVVITVPQHGYQEARSLLDEFGVLDKTEYFNVLVMQVYDVEMFMGVLRERLEQAPEKAACLSHVMPVTRSFNFQTVDEFETRAREAVTPWIPELCGKRFHVRMHRRGFKGRLSSQEEERFLDEFLLTEAENTGTPATISFEDPDIVIDVETVGQRAGLALWTRADGERYPFLKLD